MRVSTVPDGVWSKATARNGGLLAARPACASSSLPQEQEDGERVRFATAVWSAATEKLDHPPHHLDQGPQQQQAEAAGKQTHHPHAALCFGEQGHGKRQEPY